MQRYEGSLPEWTAILLRGPQGSTVDKMVAII